MGEQFRVCDLKGLFAYPRYNVGVIVNGKGVKSSRVQASDRLISSEK